MIVTGESESGIVVRPIESMDEMGAVEDLQRAVWECADVDVVPRMLLRPACEVGGVLVGAFDGARLLGFAFGLVGLERGAVALHSHMLAVLPAYRGLGLGYLLKLAQRERALANGIPLMTWTFDPLQSRNAHLNFARLGVVSNDYRIDYYGDVSTSPLHRGLGTDRLWVTWRLDSERVLGRIARAHEDTARAEAARLGAECFDAAKLVVVNKDGGPLAEASVPDAARRSAVIEIPGDIGELRGRDPALALEWRRATRDAFVAAFEAGYTVEEFARVTRHGRAAGGYLLRRKGEGEDVRQ